MQDEHSGSDRPKSIRVNLLRGWEIDRGMGMAILTLGVIAEKEDGSQDLLRSSILLSEEHCRLLAEQLSQTADRLRDAGGSA